MIEGLPLDYAHGRLAARLAQRPDDRVWSQTRSARTVAALLEAVRASPAADAVSGIEARAGADDIDRGFRQQLRHRIVEIAGWAPRQWRAAVSLTRHLIDLPALAHLLSDEPPAAWMHSDPVLAVLAGAPVSERRALLLDGELAPLARALAAAAPAGPVPALHAAVNAWRAEWRRRWPRCATDERAELLALERDVESHLLRFARVPLDQTVEARGALAHRALRHLHHHASRPVELFAYLIVTAADLERLRGEFALRAVFEETRP